ncbi:MAG: hypothetical protein KAJ48_00445, partial [Elusimicrobiales bacterium]|nr:hypothetical protein [Elusimicrobiales bacterium]
DIVGSPWPPVHGLFARIFAEGGSLGLFIWCSIWLYIFISVYKKYTLKGDNGVENIGIILLVCIPSVSLLGFLVDSFRFPEYWYVLALSWLYLEKS